MDIARLSMAMSQYNVSSQLSMGVFKMQLDQMNELGSELSEMMALADVGQYSSAAAAYQTIASLDATIGQLLDLSL